MWLCYIIPACHYFCGRFASEKVVYFIFRSFIIKSFSFFFIFLGFDFLVKDKKEGKTLNNETSKNKVNDFFRCKMSTEIMTSRYYVTKPQWLYFPTRNWVTVWKGISFRIFHLLFIWVVYGAFKRSYLSYQYIFNG